MSPREIRLANGTLLSIIREGDSTLLKFDPIEQPSGRRANCYLSTRDLHDLAIELCHEIRRRAPRFSDVDLYASHATSVLMRDATGEMAGAACPVCGVACGRYHLETCARSGIFTPWS